ncbi:MAG: ComF family protein [Bacillota bacterium]|nr:ComF family protein [Bacillota bacterium]
MNLASFVEDVLFPPECLFCGIHLPLCTRPLVCELCKEKYCAYHNKCSRCGSGFEYRGGLPFCNTCRSARYPFDGVISAYHYTGGVRDAIIRHKFDFMYNNSPTFALGISEIINHIFTQIKPDFIAIVPTDKIRLRERGYNAVSEIAEIISSKTDIPLYGNALLKIKNVPQQSTLSLRQRMRNVHGCFSVKNKSDIKNKSIILIDDVFTTGATTRECAKMLKKAGATYIFVITVAITKRSKI